MKEIDWKILSTLYETKSMTKAAESLYMTQSALTKRIKAIEEEWNIEVVKRSSTGVAFTEDGKYMVSRANMILDFLGEISDHYAENRQTKSLVKIGVPNSFARLHMPRLLSGYVKELNRLHIQMVSGSSEILLQKLVDGSIDMGMICGDYPFLGEKELLLKEQLNLVSPVGVSTEGFEKHPLIGSHFNPLVQLLIDQWWKSQFGTTPHYAHTVPSSDIAIEMVKHHLGICLVFGDDWKFDLQEVQCTPIFDADGEPIMRNVWLMMSDRCFQDPDIMDFVSFIEQCYGINESKG